MPAEPSRRFHDRVRLDTGHAGHLAWLVMERGHGPANAFTAPMVDAMTDALAAISDSVRALVLRGEREFSVGADLAAVFDAPPDRRSATIEAVAAASNRFIRSVRRLDRPVVAAVNGTAAGGGLGFALAADVVVMHADAVLDPAYARVGLTPDNATPFFLARTLGPYRAMDLLFRPRAVGAEEARELGLSVLTVEGDPDEFDAEVGAFATEIGRVPVGVQAATKSLVEAAYTESLDAHLEREREAIERAAASGVFEEGLDAFFEDRTPEWALERPTDGD